MGMGLFGGGGAFEGALVHVRQVAASGSDGGTVTNGAWRTRPLTTVVENQVDGVSLAANRLALPLGSYIALARQNFKNVNAVRTRLYDVTGSAVLVLGNSFNVLNTAMEQGAELRGRFDLAAAGSVELQFWAESNQSTNGMGAAFGTPGVDNVYAELMIWKVG